MYTYYIAIIVRNRRFASFLIAEMKKLMMKIGGGSVLGGAIQFPILQSA